MSATTLKLLLLCLLCSGISFAQSPKELNVKLRESLKEQEAIYKAQVKADQELAAEQQKLSEENKALYDQDLKQLYVNAYNLIDAAESCIERVNKLGIKAEDTLVRVKIRLNSISEMIALTVNRGKGAHTYAPESADFSTAEIDGLSLKKQNTMLGERIEEAVLLNGLNRQRLEKGNDWTKELQSYNRHIKSLLEDYKAVINQVDAVHTTIYGKIVVERERYAKEGLKNIPKEYHQAYKDEFEPRNREGSAMSWTSDKPLFRIPEGEVIVEKEEPRVLQVVEEPAEFPGGTSALLKYISDNLRYSESMKELGVYGKVFVKFIVSDLGEISDVKVMRGIEDCEECNAEAIRVVQSMPKWTPGKNNGKPVNMYYNLPIRFDAR